MNHSQPIYRFLEGIDHAKRELTSAEVAELTQPNIPERGDWFARWLVATPVANRQLTLRSFLTQVLPDASYTSYAVADGISIVYDHDNPDTNPLNFVSRNLRFITVALPEKTATTGLKDPEPIKARTLFVASGSAPDDEEEFLQCASWTPDALGKRQGLMRFYQRRDRDWVFFGDSFNAFNPDSAQHGVFCGHVGGAIIMKELTVPWTHWYDAHNADDFINSLGSTRTAGSHADQHNVLYDPLFTSANGAPFSLLERAEKLEGIIRRGIRSWYNSRIQHDIIDPSTKKPFPTISRTVKEWVGHLLLNRSINIAASPISHEQIRSLSHDIAGVPTSLFCNFNALQLVLPDVTPGGSYSIKNAEYTAVVEELQLSLFYSDGRAMPPKNRLAVANSEGPFAFPIVEPGVEDYAAIETLLNFQSTAELLPPKAIASMLMVDFCNPLYSLRRESLMKYVPESATFDPSTQTYDILKQFVDKVRASPASENPQSPEYEVLQLLSTPDDTYSSVFTARVSSYLQNIRERFSTEMQTTAALQEYMVFAEGRRRLYRGRENAKPDGFGLNEFPMTLPIAQKPDPFPFTQMKEDGSVEVMPEQDVAVFMERAKANPGGCPLRNPQRFARL